MYNQFNDERKSKKPPSLKNDLGIDGNWLKKEFNIENGEQIGQILEELRLLYHDGKINNETEAAGRVNTILNQD